MGCKAVALQLPCPSGALLLRALCLSSHLRKSLGSGGKELPPPPPQAPPPGRRGFWTGPKGDSHSPPCLAREQAPRGTQLGPLQDPKPPGLVSQGSGGLQSVHKLPRREGAAREPPSRGHRSPQGSPGQDERGRPAPRAWPTFSGNPCNSAAAGEPNPEEQGRGSVRWPVGAAPGKWPGSPCGAGCGWLQGARPGAQAGSERAWTIRALKGRPRPGPPPVSAAPRGWSPGDPDDPGPRPLPSQAASPAQPGLRPKLGGRRGGRGGGQPAAAKGTARRARAPAGVQAAPPALPAGLTSATWRRLLSPRGSGAAARGLLACAGRATTSAAGLPR